MITFEEICIITGALLIFIGVVTLIFITIIDIYNEDKHIKKSISKVEKETKKRIEKMNRKCQKK